MYHTLLCGLGTIGSQVGMNLLLENPHISLTAIDWDKVEKRNLCVQIYDASTIDMLKSDAFNAIMYPIFGDIPPNLRTSKLHLKTETKLWDYEDYDLLIDAFDNYESRDLLVGKSSNVVHLGFSPDLAATVLWDDTYKSHKSEEAGDVCEWQEYRWWLHGVTSLMTMNILYFLTDGSKKNMIIEKNLTFSNF